MPSSGEMGLRCQLVAAASVLGALWTFVQVFHRGEEEGIKLDETKLYPYSNINTAKNFRMQETSTSSS